MRWWTLNASEAKAQKTLATSTSSALLLRRVQQFYPSPFQLSYVIGCNKKMSREIRITGDICLLLLRKHIDCGESHLPAWDSRVVECWQTLDVASPCQFSTEVADDLACGTKSILITGRRWSTVSANDLSWYHTRQHEVEEWKCVRTRS